MKLQALYDRCEDDSVTHQSITDEVKGLLGGKSVPADVAKAAAIEFGIAKGLAGSKTKAIDAIERKIASRKESDDRTRF